MYGHGISSALLLKFFLELVVLGDSSGEFISRPICGLWTRLLDAAMEKFDASDHFAFNLSRRAFASAGT